MSDLRTVSFGGGVQSMGLMVLAAQRQINFRTFLFANVGDDSEHPWSIAYVEHIAKPFAEHHGLELITVQKTIGGQPDTIVGKIERTAKSEVIPVRSEADGAPMSRSCTWDFKIEALGKWLKANGASEDNKATVAVGISLDEIGRAGRAARPWERICYPLLGINTDLPDGHERPLRRGDCERLVAAEPMPQHVAESARDAGPEVLGVHVWRQLEASNFTRLPVPWKSSCFFCPFHSYEYWQDVRRDTPELFDKACRLEEQISAKAGSPRYLTRYGLPLRQAIHDGVDPLPFPDPHGGGCTTGVCEVA